MAANYHKLTQKIMNNREGYMKLTIDPGKVTHSLGDKFGIFYEDINHAADGGLYAELVQNRSFEFDKIDRWDYHAMTAWEAVERGESLVMFHVESHTPLAPTNPHYLVLESTRAGEGAGIRNLGFNDGIPIRKGETYRFSVYIRQISTRVQPLEIRLESADGRAYARGTLLPNSNEWKQVKLELIPDADDNAARLAILCKETTCVALDMVSLFPPTFGGRVNGMRRDLAGLLKDMQPKFMRFPGGCLVHDGSLDKNDRCAMYRWKNTLGDVALRPSRRNNWQYNQTLGLGFYEYFQFCEDIGAKPLPVVSAGYDPHHLRAVPMDEIEEWIQDALDLIEFANGSEETKWGQIRAQMGHPAPFTLEYLAIGNEEVGDGFRERYVLFHQRIKQVYPEIKLIHTAGPVAAGGEFERGWQSARENGSDYVDEHYYTAPEWLIAHADRYSSYDPNGPKAFLGEYASWGNKWYNALTEAAFMCGLQNAPALGLACYAPLLCNVDYMNWSPDLIWFNHHQYYPTPNYHVQALFMRHQGTHAIQTSMDGMPEPIAEHVKLTGSLAIKPTGAHCTYSNIRLRNDITGESQSFDDVSLANEDTMHVLTCTDLEHYTLSFDAIKTKSVGRKSFEIRFAYENESNFGTWSIGGWQNQDVEVGILINGRNAALTHSLITVQQDRLYHCELQILGGKIITRIDGQEINKTEHRLVEPRALYYAASYDESNGDLIIKAANVTDKACEVDLDILGLDSSAACRVIELHSLDLDAANSLEKPDVITPVEFMLPVVPHEYSFKAYSLTVLRFTGAGNAKQHG
jgi:alpha-L-arabinofuranosidase